MLVYKITQKETGKAYVGVTKRSLHKRWLAHQSAAMRRSVVECRAFHAAIRKYGRAAFETEVLLDGITDPLALEEAEAYYISACNTMAPNGYNLKPRSRGVVHTKESKARIGNALRGRPKSLAHRKKISQFVKSYRAANPDWNLKHRIKLRGKPNLSRVKPVTGTSIATGVSASFPSITEACRQLGFPKTWICKIARACLGKPRQTGYRMLSVKGYRWAYATA